MALTNSWKYVLILHATLKKKYDGNYYRNLGDHTFITSTKNGQFCDPPITISAKIDIYGLKTIESVTTRILEVSKFKENLFA